MVLPGELGLDQAQAPSLMEPLDSATWELSDVPEAPGRSIEQVELIIAAELRRALEAIVGMERWVEHRRVR